MPSAPSRVATAAPRLAIAAACVLATTAAHAGQAGDQIAHGKYLTTMGDCQGCHSTKSGKPFAGGLEMNTPFGKISTPNITPDKETGIGNYTDAQFVRVFHAGIRDDGKYLYPVMPFPWYAKVTDDDILAIKAYLFSLPPVHAKVPPPQLAFPFNIRAGLVVWDDVFLKEGVFKPDPSKSSAINRGAYIVEGLGHCGECHDSRNLLGAGKVAKPLQGGELDHWYAPNITSDVRTGIGRFSDKQLFGYLKTGAAPGMGTVVGPMALAQHESLGKLTDADLHDVVAYLKSTPAAPGYLPARLATGGNGNLPGAQAYLNHCASCHQLDGRGIVGAIPSLVGNGLVKSAGPDSVEQVVLGGVEARDTYGPMPAVGVGMNDQEVADSVNYVRAAWSNNAPATTGPGEVATIRQHVQSYLSFSQPVGCPAVTPPSIAQFVARPRIAALLQSTTAENVSQNVSEIVVKLVSSNAAAKQADIVNGLTLAYCHILQEETNLTREQRVIQLSQFSELVYASRRPVEE